MKTIKEIEDLLNDESLSKYEDMIDNYMEKLKKNGHDVSIKTLAATLIMNSTKRVVKDDYKFTSKKDALYQRFFITLGKKDQISQLGIVDFIKSKIEGLSVNDFRDVYIKDTYSFFEVDEVKKDEILAKIENSIYNDRTVHIEFSEMRRKEDKPKADFVKRGGKKYYK